MPKKRDPLTLDLERMLNQSCGHLLKSNTSKPKRKPAEKKPATFKPAVGQTSFI